MIDQPGRELRIGRQEDKDEEAARERGHTIEDDRDFRDLLRKPVISRILLAIAEPFGNHDEDRRAQDKAGKQNMELRDHPHTGAIPGVREFTDGGVRDLGIRRSPERRQKTNQKKETYTPSVLHVLPSPKEICLL